MLSFWLVFRNSLVAAVAAAGIYLVISMLLHVAFWSFLGKTDSKRYLVSGLISLGLTVITSVLFLIPVLSEIWRHITFASSIFLLAFMIQNFIHVPIERKREARAKKYMEEVLAIKSKNIR